MYQFIVLGLGFLLILGGGYLIKHMDTQGVIQTTVSASSTVSFQYPGVYLCDTDSKCQNPRTLTLSDDGSLSLATSYEDGAETNVETGTWKKENKDILLTFTTSSTTTYDVPLTVHLYAPAGNSLVTYGGATNYPGWGSPVFRRQDQGQE